MTPQEPLVKQVLERTNTQTEIRENFRFSLMVGNYAVLAERISSLSSLSRLREVFNPDVLQFARQRL